MEKGRLLIRSFGLIQVAESSAWVSFCSVAARLTSSRAGKPGSLISGELCSAGSPPGGGVADLSVWI